VPYKIVYEHQLDYWYWVIANWRQQLKTNLREISSQSIRW